jgi:hypothetical protein
VVRRVGVHRIAAVGSGQDTEHCDEEEDCRVDPGRGTSNAVPELISEDFAKSHDVTSGCDAATRRR